MDVVSFLENPLPKLEIDIEKIAVSLSSVREGSFNVRNTGGGIITGRVLSNCECLKFSPEEFTGKSAAIHYTIDISGRKPGEIIKTTAVIMSNGGEKTIPVIIKAAPISLKAREISLNEGGGVKITDIKEFCKFAKKHSKNAWAAFGSKAFDEWLSALDYQHLDAYRELVRDTNKERAMDNFFVLNRLKKQAKVSVKEKEIAVSANPYTGDVLSGSLSFTRTAWGYTNVFITKENDSPWFITEKSTLTAKDFNAENKAVLDFFVDPKMLPDKPGAAEALIISGTGIMQTRIPVLVGICRPFTASPQKESCTRNEQGVIDIKNNTGRDMEITMTSSESFIFFPQTKMRIGASAAVPFLVKPSGIIYAQNTLRKRLGLPAIITITAPEHGYKKEIRVTAGI